MPTGVVGEHLVNLSPPEAAGGDPSVRAEDRDLPDTIGEPAKGTGYDTKNALVEAIEFVLRAAVAGVAATVGEQPSADCGLADTPMTTPASAASSIERGDDQLEPTRRRRMDAIEPPDDHAGLDPRLDLWVRLDRRDVAPRRARTSHACGFRAPRIRHFAGSSSREYSSGNGDRSG